MAEHSICQPGRPRAQRGLPGVFANAVRVSFDRLPEGEVAGCVLLVFIDVDACAVFDPFEIFLRELAVFREARDAEVPAAVFSLVGDILRAQILDQRDHLGYVVSRMGDNLGTFKIERGHVLKESGLVFRAVLTDVEVCCRGVANDLVVDVGDVHDVTDIHADLLQVAAQHVDVDEGAEVADVAVVVDGGSAGVHAEVSAVAGQEGFDAPCEGIEEFHC